MENINTSLSTFFDSIFNGVGEWGLSLIGALVFLIIGLWIIRIFMKAISKSLNKSKIDTTLAPFLLTLIGFSFKALLFITIAQIVGVPMTSFAVILGGIGIAIGAAFNGSLGHLA